MTDCPDRECVECLREEIASYRLLVPRLQEQTEAARREAAGMAPKPKPCDSKSRTGVSCDLQAGHPAPHMHRGDNCDWSWGP
jgi:hypothetical protein